MYRDKILHLFSSIPENVLKACENLIYFIMFHIMSLNNKVLKSISFCNIAYFTIIYTFVQVSYR